MCYATGDELGVLVLDPILGWLFSDSVCPLPNKLFKASLQASEAGRTRKRSPPGPPWRPGLQAAHPQGDGQVHCSSFYNLNACLLFQTLLHNGLLQHSRRATPDQARKTSRPPREAGQQPQLRQHLQLRLEEGQHHEPGVHHVVYQALAPRSHGQELSPRSRLSTSSWVQWPNFKVDWETKITST